jgi:predicted RNA-binding protein with PUA domain
MLLNVKNRIMLLNSIPKSGNMKDIFISMDIFNKVKFSAEETNIIIEKDERGAERLLYENFPKIEDVEFEFIADELSFLKNFVTDLDNSKTVNFDNLELCTLIKNA